MKYLIFFFAFAFAFSSCSKDKNGVFTEYTALKFTEKNTTDIPNYKYHYTLLKYNNSWYERKLSDGSKKTFTDVLKIDVFSNKEKPMNQWIGYVQWMKDTTILTFRNTAIDSMPTYYKKIEVTESELYAL